MTAFIKAICPIPTQAIGKLALHKHVTTLVFDRGNKPYHGRIASVADGAREAGLIF